MKTQSIAAWLIAGLVVACGGAADEQPPLKAPPPPPVPTATADSPVVADTSSDAAPAPKPAFAELQATALGNFTAFAADAAKRSALYASDGSLWIPGLGDSKGPAAIQQTWQSFLDGTTNLMMAPVRSWTKGKQVALEIVATGTDKASSKPWGVDGIAILTFNDDGLIANDHTYVDLLTIKKQTGAYKDATPPRAILPLPTAAVEAHVARGDATEEKNVTGEKGIVAAWAKLDLKGVTGFYAPEATLDDQDDAKVRTVPELKKAFTSVMHGLKDAKWTDWADFGVEDFTIDDGEFATTRTDKKSVVSHAAEVDQWKDGKIVKSWSWSNGLEVAKQLGIGPFAKSAAKPAPKKDDPGKPPSGTH